MDVGLLMRECGSDLTCLIVVLLSLDSALTVPPELSRAVNAVEKRLVAGGQERWGRRVRRLQQLEQRKFRAVRRPSPSRFPSVFSPVAPPPLLPFPCPFPLPLPSPPLPPLPPQTVQLQVLRAEEALRGQAGLSSLLAPAVPAAADDDVEGDVDGGSAGRGARATGGAGAGAGVDKGSLLRELQAVAGQLAPELERLRVRVMGEGDDVDGDADGLSDGWDDDEADGPAG